jgi:branched-chain amino acid transport system substrate-binding protein
MRTHRPYGPATMVSAGVIAMLTAATACSSGSSSGSTSSANSSPINVGELFPLSGQYAAAGQLFLTGVQAAVADVNAHGGVFGHQLKQYVGDTAGDPVDTVPALRQLQTHNLTFLVGPTSLEFASVQNVIASTQLADFVLTPSPQFDNLYNAQIWKIVVSDTTDARAMAYYAIHKGLMSCSIVAENIASTQALLPALIHAYTSHGGKIQANVQLTPQATSYRSEVEKAFQGNPQCLFLEADPTTSGTLFTDIRQLGHYNVAFVGSDSYTNIQTAKAIGLSSFSKYVTGMMGALPSGPAYAYFSALYNKMFKGQTPTYFSAADYDAVIIASLAMTAAKSTDPAVWNKYIETVANSPGTVCETYASCVSLLKAGKKIHFEGASGRTNFDKYHNVTTGFNTVTFTPAGALKTVMSISAADLSGY